MDLLLLKIFPEFCFYGSFKKKRRGGNSSQVAAARQDHRMNFYNIYEERARSRGPQAKPPSGVSSACWLRYATNCVRELTCSFL